MKRFATPVQLGGYLDRVPWFDALPICERQQRRQ